MLLAGEQQLLLWRLLDRGMLLGYTQRQGRPPHSALCSSCGILCGWDRSQCLSKLLVVLWFEASDRYDAAACRLSQASKMHPTCYQHVFEVDSRRLRYNVTGGVKQGWQTAALA